MNTEQLKQLLRDHGTDGAPDSIEPGMVVIVRRGKCLWFVELVGTNSETIRTEDVTSWAWLPGWGPDAFCEWGDPPENLAPMYYRKVECQGTSMSWSTRVPKFCPYCDKPVKEKE